MNKKSIIFSFLLVLSTACNNVPSQIITEPEINKTGKTITELEQADLPVQDILELDKSYGKFKTKAQTETYINNKLNNYINFGNDAALLRELKYIKFKYSKEFYNVLDNDPSLYFTITSISNVISTRASNPLFDLFIKRSDPTLPAPVAVSAGTLKSENFIANWNEVLNATSGYELEVFDGVTSIGLYTIPKPTITSYRVTGLDQDKNYTYVVRGKRSSIGIDSNTINVSTPIYNVNTLSGTVGDAVGAMASAQFNDPVGFNFDSTGKLLITDGANNKVKVYDPSTDNVSTLITGLSYPSAVDFATNGDIYVSAYLEGNVKRYNSAGTFLNNVYSVSNVESVALDNTNNVYYSHRDDGTQALNVIYKNGIALNSGGLWRPFLHFAENGKLYGSSYFGNQVFEINTSTGALTTIAGTGTAGFNGDGIQATNAQINRPTYLTSDKDNNLYFSEETGRRYRKVNLTTGVISTLAGTGVSGTADGASTSATFEGPMGIVKDKDGNFYTSSWPADTIRKISIAAPTPSDFVTGLGSLRGMVFDGTYVYVSEFSTGKIKKITLAGSASDFTTGLTNPFGLAIDYNGDMYVGEETTNTIKKINSAGTVTNASFVTGLNGPYTIKFYSGNLYVAERNSGLIKKITTTGTVTTYASGLSQPVGITFDNIGNMYVTEFNGSGTIKKIDTSGNITTFASSLAFPFGIIYNPASNDFYVAEIFNNRVIKLNSSGVVTNSSFVTSLSSPSSLILDNSQNLYISQESSGTIKKIAL